MNNTTVRFKKILTDEKATSLRELTSRKVLSCSSNAYG
jgi:hypothetical protein